jgi:hypothetical protein
VFWFREKKVFGPFFAPVFLRSSGVALESENGWIHQAGQKSYFPQLSDPAK